MPSPPTSAANTRHRAEDSLRILNSFAVSMLQARSLDDLLWSIADNVGRLLGFEDCVVYLRQGDELHQLAAFGVKNLRERVVEDPIRLPIGTGVVGCVARSGVPRLVDDTRECADYVADDFPGGRSELAVPIVYRGRTIAVLDSESSEPVAFDAYHLEMLVSIANIAAPRIASALEEEQRRSVEDELQQTRQALEERVEERTRKLVQTVRRLEEEIQERRRTRGVLEEERRLLRLTLDSIEEGVLATDGAGQVILVSSAALRLTGLTREEALGRQLEEVYRTASDEAHPSTRLLRSRTGEEVLVDEVVAPVGDDALGLVIAFRDVTLERALEVEANKSQRMESLGLLAGGIAHDFNNVLTGILGNVNLAQLCGEMREEALGEAESGCLRARDLTKELLTFAKGGSPVTSTGSIRELVLEVVRFCLHGSAVEPRLDLADDLHLVEIDAVQIRQVLNNLVLNAVQSMPDGGTVHVRAANVLEPDGEPRVSITVRDEGAGIPAAERERIFDPYFTTKSRHSGLGLATSYWIVNRHGGRLELAHSSAEGTTFQIQLPAAKQAARSAVNGRAAPRGLRVLLMDDELPVQRTVANMLRHLGQEVTCASHGEEALTRFEEARQSGAPFDVALLDLTVRGGMGGKRTLEHLHAQEPEFPAIVISGYSDDPIVADHRAHGFLARLEKPFQLKQIEEVLKLLPARPSGRA